MCGRSTKLAGENGDHHLEKPNKMMFRQTTINVLGKEFWRCGYCPTFESVRRKRTVRRRSVDVGGEFLNEWQLSMNESEVGNDGYIGE